jgi:hypothetical protein
LRKSGGKIRILCWRKAGFCCNEYKIGGLFYDEAEFSAAQKEVEEFSAKVTSTSKD